MAEATLNNVAQANAVAIRYRKLKHRVWDLTIEDTNTWTSGIQGLEYVAWEADGSGDEASVVITTVATGVVTFQTPGTENGYLHTWSRS